MAFTSLTYIVFFYIRLLCLFFVVFKAENILAVAMQLLFLYELECEVCILNALFDDHNVSERHPYRKGGDKAAAAYIRMFILYAESGNLIFI